MDVLSLVMRWMHILSAITAVGGTLFMRVAFLPSLTVLSESDNNALRENVRAHWAKWVHGAVAFLLVSGIFNAVVKFTRYKLPVDYHATFGIKVLLALAIMMIASVMVGRSALAQRMRSNARYWLNLNLALAVLLVLLSGYLRQTSQDIQPRQSSLADFPAVSTSPATEFAGH